MSIETQTKPNTKPSLFSFLKYHLFLLLFILAVSLFFGQLSSEIISIVQKAMAIDAAQPLKATAVITSKDSDQMLSVKSADLPKRGDVIRVDQYVYGAASVGDSFCVQYKPISDDPQYGIEFVSNGKC